MSFRDPLYAASKPPVVRAMAVSDAETMLAIASASAAAPHWGLAEYERIPLSSQVAPLFRFAIVAEWDGIVAGFAVVNVLRSEELAELESLAVHSDFKRRGIGAALLDAAVRRASTAAARTLRLEVRASNAAAISLYLRQGFHQAARRRAYYSAPPEDALLFELLLP